MADAGRYGVQLFFILSAFLAFISLNNKPVGCWKDYIKYLKRKILRLVPVLYIAILWNLTNYSITIGHIPPLTDDIWKKVLFSSLFINGFSYHYFNSWMTWYIGVYVIFIAIAPLLHRCINSLKRAILFFTISAIFGWSLNIFLVRFCGVMSDDWFFYGWLPRQLPAFALGIITFHISKADSYRKIRKSIMSLIFVLSTGFLLSLCAFTSPLEPHIQYGVLLLVFSHILFSRPWKCLNWIKSIGDQSYGIYLFHGCLIWVINTIAERGHWEYNESILKLLIYYIVLIISSYIASLVINHVVEKPFIKLLNRAK